MAISEWLIKVFYMQNNMCYFLCKVINLKLYYFYSKKKSKNDLSYLKNFHNLEQDNFENWQLWWHQYSCDISIFAVSKEATETPAAALSSVLCCFDSEFLLIYLFLYFYQIDFEAHLQLY